MNVPESTVRLIHHVRQARPLRQGGSNDRDAMGNRFIHRWLSQKRREPFLNTMTAIDSIHDIEALQLLGICKQLSQLLNQKIAAIVKRGRR